MKRSVKKAKKKEGSEVKEGKNNQQLDIKAIEKRWQNYWEKEQIYRFDPKEKIAFSIDTPPPTVSGKMHLGHAFSYAQQDFIARFRRMYHGNIFYPFGTDDNGLPTERLVEKLNGVKSKNMSRSEFIGLCLKTLEKIRRDFIQDWKRLGISCDYDLYYSTIDKHCQRISQKSFIELYKKGLIYTAEFPTIFCVECQTPVAQAELEDKQEQTLFTTIAFQIKNSKEKINIATTRPEFLASCLAIFVNPSDERYKKFIGKKVIVPIFGQEVEIMEDSSADMAKGTGAMMVCSYGDKYDVEAIKRKKLKPKIIFNYNGTMNERAGKFKGRTIKEAREAVLGELAGEKLIVKQEKIMHVVNVHDKCGTPIEFLPTRQWFVKILDKKKEFIEQGRKIKWYPDFMKKRYENWINGLEWDWSISRERHFGVPIPAWYCKKCKQVILAEEKQLPVDPIKEKPKRKCKCGSSEFEPERNVLDTWATSSLTPEIALLLINKEPSKFLPMTLRPQAHDIIRTWAFYTIVKALYHYNKIPWQEIMISGFVTLGGEKMAKSKGNVIEPQDIMEKKGIDALRFWAASSKLGEDLEYQEKDLLTGQKTIIKLWNAAKFVSIHLKKIKKPKKIEAFDLWLLSKLNRLIREYTEAMENYEYSKAKSSIEQFFWRVFCDNYLEIIKKRIYQGNTQEKNSAQYSLYNAFLTLLKLFAPIMPYITEEIYQKYFKQYEKVKSIHIAKWPGAESDFIDDKIEEKGDRAIKIINEVRQSKSKAQKSLKTEIILTIEKEKIQELEGFIEDLKAVTVAREIKEGKFGIKLL
ncbi:MAG: valine--tRNA ligase [Candidatus Pacearchaeota archaeon]|nr:valine--tRNA ligase [Candidatus Pacearchaeota archaeon]